MCLKKSFHIISIREWMQHEWKTCGWHSLVFYVCIIIYEKKWKNVVQKKKKKDKQSTLMCCCCWTVSLHTYSELRSIDTMYGHNFFHFYFVSLSISLHTIFHSDFFFNYTLNMYDDPANFFLPLLLVGTQSIHTHNTRNNCIF